MEKDFRPPRRFCGPCHSEEGRSPDVGIPRYNTYHCTAIRWMVPGDCHVTPAGFLAMTALFRTAPKDVNVGADAHIGPQYPLSHVTPSCLSLWERCPKSLILDGEGVVPQNYGMLASGKHIDTDSLRYSQRESQGLRCIIWGIATALRPRNDSLFILNPPLS